MEKKPTKRIAKWRKVKMFAVYSKWGFHAFYENEELAKKHWKSSKKYDIYYQIYPCKIVVSPSVNITTIWKRL